MRIRAVTAVLLALSATACSTGVNAGKVSGASPAGATPAAQSAAAETPTWGKRYTWPDGLAVEVAAPTTCKPGKYAAPQGVQRAAKFAVKIVNGTDKPYATSLISAGAEAQFDGRKAEPVFDSSGPCGSGGGMESATVLPGKTYAYDVAYSVGPAAGEVQLTFAPHFGADAAVFVGRA